jgi:hypothetical protein
MSFESMNDREHHATTAADSPAGAPMRTRRSPSRSRWALLLTAIFTVSGGLLPATAWSADRYYAFYYNAKGELLQVESVPDAEMTTRTLEDIDATTMVIPMLTQVVVPRLKEGGKNVRKSKNATIAVYYTYKDMTPPPKNNDENIQAYPVKVEDLQFVGSRKLTECLPRDGSEPCLFPKRCHCLTGGCCCY